MNTLKSNLTFLSAVAGSIITASAQLPDPGLTVNLGNTALVITDPQNDFLSPDGVSWGVVGESVTENGTVAHIDQLFAAAKRRSTTGWIVTCRICGNRRRFSISAAGAGSCC